MLKVKLFHFNPLEACCPVLWQEGSAQCVVADPGMSDDDEREAFVRLLEGEGVTPVAVLLTHGHFDHVFGAAWISKKYGIPVYMNPADSKILSQTPAFAQYYLQRTGDGILDFSTVDISDGDVLTLADISFKVIATPGHTPGGVCFYVESDSLLLSGDTLFAGSIGRTDLPGGDYDVLMSSVLGRVMTLPGDTDVIPGHGPATTIARESATNPFLLPFNEPDDTAW